MAFKFLTEKTLRWYGANLQTFDGPHLLNVRNLRILMVNLFGKLIKRVCLNKVLPRTCPQTLTAVMAKISEIQETA